MENNKVLIAPPAYRPLYDAVNRLMATVGAYGEVTARHPDVTAVMDALHEIDEGEYIEPPSPWGADETMVIAAFRYSLGRMTYIVSDCCDWLIEQWPNFSERTRELIQKELEAAFERDGVARKDSSWAYISKPLGHDCDREQWERVRRLWEVKG